MPTAHNTAQAENAQTHGRSNSCNSTQHHPEMLQLQPSSSLLNPSPGSYAIKWCSGCSALCNMAPVPIHPHNANSCLGWRDAPSVGHLIERESVCEPLTQCLVGLGLEVVLLTGPHAFLCQTLQEMVCVWGVLVHGHAPELLDGLDPILNACACACQARALQI